MAIRLKVLTNQVKLKMSVPDEVKMSASVGIPIYPDPYLGETEVTPSAETQILPTDGLMMTSNVTVNPIPSNYGLITWNGSTLTVS